MRKSFKPKSVIEMPVREQDRLHVAGAETELVQPPADLPRLADEPRVEQHRVPCIVHQQMAHAHDAADRVDAGRDVAHGRSSREPRTP